MKNRIPILPLFYIAFALSLLVGFGYTQSRGIRLLNIFSGSLYSHSGHDGPDHK
jgi:hypothetical protein